MGSIPEYLYSSLDNHHSTFFPIITTTTTATTTDLSGLPPTMTEDGGLWCNDDRELLLVSFGSGGCGGGSGINSTTATSCSSSTINNYNNNNNNALSSSSTDSLLSSTSSLSPAFMVSAAAFPEQNIVGGGFVPSVGGALYSHDYLSNFNDMISNNNDDQLNNGFNYGGYNGNISNNNGFVEFGDQDYSSCNTTSFFPEFKPVVGLLASGDQNWVGMQSCNQMHGIEDSNIMKVSRYSEEERKERIVRYLKKRNQRNFNKTIKYACRKTLADRRVRVRGRFARNNELCHDHDDQFQPKNNNNELLLSHNNNNNNIINNNNTCKQNTDFCSEVEDDIADTVQIKYDDEEDWLQDFALCCFVNGGIPNNNNKI
ncbi:uncharacterized protein LOC115711273 [Cannabis sativa]|uniref:uncharacterized protein LOC115711273 n=1 Tax=Cannabis sativa TaxID=3483 RepID=UPI0029C9F82A|nr:uncharacterized protein LOC115711273 [Cannabis sativa]